MALAERIKEALNSRGMSMTDLANETGITYNMIKKYCAGEADPTISYALSMAKVLGVSLDSLMDYEPPKESNMFREVFEHDFTYIEGFKRVVRKFPEKEAMIDPLKEKTWTYKQLNSEVNKLANALADKGITKGDVVFYQLPNCPEFVF